LDEPTDVLEDRSRQDLFKVIAQLKHEQNVSFIYISHRYAEVPEVGDRVTILRDGRNAGTYTLKELGFSQTVSNLIGSDYAQGVALNKMIELMVGGTIKKQYPNLKNPSDDNALQIENLNQKGHLYDINLTIKKGEIVGVTGLMGAGRLSSAGRSPVWIPSIQEPSWFMERKFTALLRSRPSITVLPISRKTGSLSASFRIIPSVITMLYPA